MIRRLCFAKINLYLKVLGKRPDGYHELETLFQEIDLADELTWVPGSSPLRLEISGADLGDPQSNLVLRAARDFATHTGLNLGGRMVLHKKVPVGGGLGGGSSDAAAALTIFNDYFGRPIGPQTLSAMAAALGADVPFFLKGGRMLGRGKGDLLEPAPAYEGPRAGLLLIPPFRLETAHVFGAFRDSDRQADLSAEAAPELGRNDLLSAARRISFEFASVWDLLAPSFNTYCLFMTGSGSTMVVLGEPDAILETCQPVAQRLGLALKPFRFRPDPA